MAKRMISYGSSGEDVKELQKALNNAGYSLDVDGKFGTKTQSAVKSYQKSKGLAVDGIVGDNTWTSLSGNVTSKTNNKTQAISTTNSSTIKQPVEKNGSIKELCGYKFIQLNCINFQYVVLLMNIIDKQMNTVINKAKSCQDVKIS